MKVKEGWDLNELLLIGSVVVLGSILMEKAASSLKIPMLIGFIALGMFFGVEGPLSIPFDNYELTERICSAALIIVMFYGGFGTSWKQARPAAFRAGLLATIGVIFTALLCGLFIHTVFGFSWILSLLLGSLLSSTDAASVFSILRSRDLALKDHTDSMLEVESGSNDPVAYMLTILCLMAMKQPVSAGEIVLILSEQVGFGLLTGWLCFWIMRFIIRKAKFEIAGFYTSFVLAGAVFCYAFTSMIGGNGYLAVYLCGLLLGNSGLPDQKQLVHFFDGLGMLMQMMIFFILGFLSVPSRILHLLPVSFAIFLFLTFAARPLMVFSILGWFKKSTIRQMALVSFSGLRGVASIVFAIMAMTDDAFFTQDLFHIVFGVVLFSILIQGSLLPWAARKLDMIETGSSVLKIFSDYEETTDLRLIRISIDEHSSWTGKTLAELNLPDNLLVSGIERQKKSLAPSGESRLVSGDCLILAGRNAGSREEGRLREEKIEEGDRRIGRALKELDGSQIPLILCIERQGRFIIPGGETILEKGDVFVWRT